MNVSHAKTTEPFSKKNFIGDKEKVKNHQVERRAGSCFQIYDAIRISKVFAYTFLPNPLTNNLKRILQYFSLWRIIIKIVPFNDFPKQQSMTEIDKKIYLLFYVKKQRRQGEELSFSLSKKLFIALLTINETFCHR